ncbi:MAG: hypothetical protein U5J99_10575 [Parvularculaceae bacterium]|nr:hypothetical protein [Parvularculaceae bacterium]
MAAALAWAAPAQADQRAAMVGEAAREGFDAAEETRLEAAASNQTDAIKALAEFYAAHHLWPEALAALARLPARNDAAERLAIEAEYRLARYRRAALRAEGNPQLAAFRAMALTRLGAYAEAAALFEKAPAPEALSAEYYLAAAEASVATGDRERARKALAEASRYDLSSADTDRVRFLRARIDEASDAPRARAAMQSLALGAPNEWTMRARLATTAEAGAIAALGAQWKSQSFDREALAAEAAARLAASDLRQAFAAYATIAGRFPESDAALEAQSNIGAGLARVFEPGARLSAEEAARTFFRYVAFAPPGREGDALIRKAADRLARLGLHAEAAALVDHQVFKRLRGAERSRIAADLADLHLAAKAPDAALRALRATRMAGLDPATNARRLRLEALALAALGRREAALTLLDKATSADDLALRASIAWDDERWAQAALDYAASFAGLSGPLSKSARETAMRAATAFLLAGDRAGYRQFAMAAAPRLEGTPEQKLMASLGDIDRDVFLSRFMTDYRALYAGGG